MSATTTRRAARLYLHIGCEKTGTTTIQRCLARNRHLLRRAGILYPKSPGAFNHFDLSIHCLELDRVTPLRRARGLTSPEAIENVRREIEHRLVEEVAAAAPSRVVLSSEQLSSNVQSLAEAARLVELLYRVAEEIEIVCYLRRQDEMCLSSYSTEVKAGRATRFDPAAVQADSVKYDFRRMLGLWAQAAPHARLNVRLFDSRVIGPDVMADFARAVGLEGIPLERIEPQNTSMDVYAIELLRLMNPYLPRHGDPGQARGNLQELMTALSDGPRMSLAPGDSARIMEKFAESNGWVRAQYFSALEFDPFGAASTAVAPPHPECTPEKLAEYAARLWLLKQRQFLDARASGTDEIGDRSASRVGRGVV